MSLNELAKEAHQISVEHGWWDPEPSFGDLVALMHSELSEALEEFRSKRPMVWHKCMTCDGDTPCMEGGCGDWDNGTCELTCLSPKPEGIAVELADCIIRILDWAGHEGVEMDRIFGAVKNHYPTWEVAPVQKFGDFISGLHNLLSMAYTDEEDMRGIYFCMVIDYIQEALKQSGVDLYTVMRAKMEYNRTRPYRHGGKVL